ncbi:MAG: daunorubicin resistance protein DrrC [Actinobacteria bacterium HGW-Actinobacteria-2]|nr:MAG: daunorubicin resistance protein DrrC [Actinobacteria bacterium HGW-Actinobacteria-2]
MTQDAPAPQPADSHEFIRVRGAREHNLKNVDLDLPKRRLTVFTGVSGSGKSSLVFSTIAAESQRLINETYSAFLQGFMPNLDRPEVDLLEGLTTAIIVDQERIGGNPRSTLGTVTDANAMLRILFSRLATPSLGSPQAYSFNVATVHAAGAITIEKGPGKPVKQKASFTAIGGMCPRCEGLGVINDIDLTGVYDASKSLTEGAILVPGYSADGWYIRIFGQVVPADIPVRAFTDRQLHEFLYGEPRKVKAEGINVTHEGLIPRIQKSFLSKDIDSLQPHIRAFVERVATFTACPDCGGTRLNEGARTSTITGVSIADACAMQVSDLVGWVRSITDPSVAPLVTKLADLLDGFIAIGLGYLSLDRASGTLSGGEAQRAKMVRHLGSALTDITYVFDEPSIGLHPADLARVNTVLQGLRDKGNTVLVIEHKPEVIAIADQVVDLGPGAGQSGGEVCFTGTVEALRGADTITGRHLDDRARLKGAVRTPSGQLELRHVTSHNVHDLSVDLPLGVLTVITGVAGSGKSSLIDAAVAPLAEVAVINQDPIRGSRRSNPATYTGALEPIRKAFAKANGVKPALFSANSEGACQACNGSGVITTDLGVMASVETTCEVCGGRRFDAAVLDYHLGGLSIADVFELSAGDAATFFADTAPVPAARAIADRLVDVGLGYLRLGQPLTTLSGGERQRLKLAAQLGDPAGIYVLDEPTVGLHLADVDNLLGLLDRLVDAGRSVIVIEHHQAVMAHADWIVDLGPGAGHDGGRVVFSGPPAELVAGRHTLTGQHLADYIAR